MYNGISQNNDRGISLIFALTVVECGIIQFGKVTFSPDILILGFNILSDQHMFFPIKFILRQIICSFEHMLVRNIFMINISIEKQTQRLKIVFISYIRKFCYQLFGFSVYINIEDQHSLSLKKLHRNISREIKLHFD